MNINSKEFTEIPEHIIPEDFIGENREQVRKALSEKVFNKDWYTRFKEDVISEDVIEKAKLVGGIIASAGAVIHGTLVKPEIFEEIVHAGTRGGAFALIIFPLTTLGVGLIGGLGAMTGEYSANLVKNVAEDIKHHKMMKSAEKDVKKWLQARE
ncbi:hypothetical protein KKH23_03605 [Patescibacteria group bacterium]|uniref:Uncharacterized protein n=1 Tax=viral metagenome TaxID=1070528 RepID=A0A6M3M6D0_9ZZZZ|nr:hypothetical protein [Patescibacteria group bacterium]MBU0776870.1 hypothetical protein [Patescibacteria group bacterium]MBU0846251.1 hypothetical protein [Patescibacteria group bacterium]MBU0922598.1 hypothetical protein [Patescibacteria group bacterium]MBU1066649.1 hypothetical protein [Patescibacteria group bacterium]